MSESLLEELKRYMSWSEADERMLRDLQPHVMPEAGAITTAFYERIHAHAAARAVLEGGDAQVHRLQGTLVAWLERLLTGPWGEDYFQLGCRIGRMHVRISLPQHYMLTAMNVVRGRLHAIAERSPETNTAPVREAIDKVLDLELAIMLHAYREDLMAAQARAERLGTFGQLAGSIGHELRNPLGVIETSLYLLGSKLPDDERVRKHVGRIGEQLRLANGIITNMLDIIRDRPMARQRVRLDEVFESVLGSVRGDGARIDMRGFDVLPSVAGDPVLLRQIFLNLVQNAQQAAGIDGCVTIDAATASGDDGDSVTVGIEDSGPGVDPSVRGRLFEPLVTTKRTGIGLGLALVKRLVERHGGTIQYVPREGHGARFVVTLPSEAR